MFRTLKDAWFGLFCFGISSYDVVMATETDTVWTRGCYIYAAMIFFVIAASDVIEARRG